MGLVYLSILKYTAPFGSFHAPFGMKFTIFTLLLFIDKPSAGLKDNPLALFLADDALFAASYDSFNGFDYFFRHQINALISLRVPFR